MAETTSENRACLAGESSTSEDGTTNTSLSDMFSLLLQEMKSINSGISALQDSRHFDNEGVDLDEATLHCQPTATRKVNLNNKLESIDTRVDKLVGQSKTDLYPDILTNIAQEFAIKETTGGGSKRELGGHSFQPGQGPPARG